MDIYFFQPRIAGNYPEFVNSNARQYLIWLMQKCMVVFFVSFYTD